MIFSRTRGADRLSACPAVLCGQGAARLWPERRASRRNELAAERGQEIIEFAIVIAALMMLLMGVVVFARAYNIYQSITRAAREGARVAALPSSVNKGDTFVDGNSSGSTSDAIFLKLIAPALRAASLDPNQVANYSETIGWLNAGDASQQCGVRISFRYPVHINIPFTASTFSTFNVSTNVQMRREDQPVRLGGASPTCP